MIQLNDQNNFGVKLRTLIRKNMDHWKIGGVIHLSLLKRSIEKISIPREYWGDVLQMANYKKLDRIKTR